MQQQRLLGLETVNANVERVAAALPFPVVLDADMGGTFALHIDLGRRGGVDDPHDTAGIDPDQPDARWWIDIEGGQRSIISDYGIDAPTDTVAAWISTTAHAEGCPAVTDTPADRDREIVKVSIPTPKLSAADPQEPACG